MIEKNLKIITSHLNDNKEEKNNAIKDMLSVPEDELFDKTEFNFSDAGLKYKPVSRADIQISINDLIDNSYTVFSKYNNNISNEEFLELKIEIEKLPIQLYPVIFFIEGMYIDLSAYHIFHFIKDTKHILSEIENKDRYFYSTYQTKVIETQIKLMEKIKTEKFLYPKTEFDQEVLTAKDKLLNYASEHYNILFAFNALTASFNLQGIYKDHMIDQVANDFQESLNSIRVTKKDAIKSLAILLFHMYDTKIDETQHELAIENILRIFFNDEIEEINKNKNVALNFMDTFKITTKEYRKNVYIYAFFDKVPIYGINRENKYFYFYKMNEKEVMRMYFESLKDTSPDQDIAITKINYQIIKERFLKHPHKALYQRQYPEFFTMENSTELDMMVSFFKMMKKTAPDNLR